MVSNIMFDDHSFPRPSTMQGVIFGVDNLSIQTGGDHKSTEEGVVGHSDGTVMLGWFSSTLLLICGIGGSTRTWWFDCL